MFRLRPYNEGLVSELGHIMLFETLFQGRNLLIMAALGVLIVLVAVV
ncbi:MAG: hypothetical protein ABI700_04300 [Chloroflexota bacterium]